jgi:hypothetical protein
MWGILTLGIISTPVKVASVVGGKECAGSTEEWAVWTHSPRPRVVTFIGEKMTKGFGTIMAELAMADSANRQKDNPRCPICKEIMDYNGVAWFCLDDHSMWLGSRREAAFRYQEGGGIVFWVDIKTPERYRSRNWDPDMQNVILAVTETGWNFSTTRGGGGKTNFRVQSPENWTPEGGVPSLDDWEWAEWVDKAGSSLEPVKEFVPIPPKGMVLTKLLFYYFGSETGPEDQFLWVALPPGEEVPESVGFGDHGTIWSYARNSWQVWDGDEWIEGECIPYRGDQE